MKKKDVGLNGFVVFKLISRNIKTFGKKSKNYNNIKLKAVGNKNLSPTAIPGMNMWKIPILKQVCYVKPVN